MKRMYIYTKSLRMIYDVVSKFCVWCTGVHFAYPQILQAHRTQQNTEGERVNNGGSEANERVEKEEERGRRREKEGGGGVHEQVSCGCLTRGES